MNEIVCFVKVGRVFTLYLHTNTHLHNKVMDVCLPVTSYQMFARGVAEGRAVCIPGPVPCRLPVNYSVPRFTEATLNAVE